MNCGELLARDAAKMREFRASRRANFSVKTRFESGHARTRRPVCTGANPLHSPPSSSNSEPGPAGRACSASADQDCRCAQVRNQSRRDRGGLPQDHRRRNASNATPPTPTHSNTRNTRPPNAGPPRRGPKSRDDAAQLRRDAASTYLGARARPASTNSAVGLRAGDPAGHANGESEESAAEAPQPRAEAPRPHPGEDSTFAAQFTRF